MIIYMVLSSFGDGPYTTEDSFTNEGSAKAFLDDLVKERNKEWCTQLHEETPTHYSDGQPYGSSVWIEELVVKETYYPKH